MDQGNFRKQESVLNEFRHSCLGRIIICASIVAVLLVIAALTNPSSKRLEAATKDNIRQSIESNDSINVDWTDVLVSCIGNTFSSADGPVNRERWDWFFKRSRNRVSFTDHTFYSTVEIINGTMIEPEVCSIGIFGMVIPIVNFNRFLLRDEPLQDKPGKKLIDGGDNEEYLGETPELEPFRNMYGE